MKTGEGKTLVATLPAYLNSVIGNKAILVTVNDYLARRDAEWMRPIYEFLGLTVGVVVSNQEFSEKSKSYESDVIYATNNELGFDYLRDNMAHSAASSAGSTGASRASPASPPVFINSVCKPSRTAAWTSSQ